MATMTPSYKMLNVQYNNVTHTYMETCTHPSHVMCEHMLQLSHIGQT
jgi:hypothetical protein